MSVTDFFKGDTIVSMILGIIIGVVGCSLMYFYFAPPHHTPSRGGTNRSFNQSGTGKAQTDVQRQMMRTMRNSQNGGQRRSE